MSFTYSTIEEAWGSDFYGKKKNKKIADPICDLYASSNHNTDHKIDYSVIRSQRTTLPQRNSQAREYREPQLRQTVSRPIETNLFEQQFKTKMPNLFEDTKCTNVGFLNDADFAKTPSEILQEQKYIYDYPNINDKSAAERNIQKEIPFINNFDSSINSAQCNNINPIINSEYNRGLNNYGIIQTEQENIPERQIPTDYSNIEAIYDESINKQSTYDHLSNIYNVNEEQRTSLFPISPERQKPFVYVEDEEETNKTYYKKPEIINNKTYNNIPQEYKTYEEKEITTGHKDLHLSGERVNKFKILDLILYIISGIILIFIMEQFVRIGMNLRI